MYILFDDSRTGIGYLYVFHYLNDEVLTTHVFFQCKLGLGCLVLCGKYISRILCFNNFIEN